MKIAAVITPAEIKRVFDRERRKQRLTAKKQVGIPKMTPHDATTPMIKK